MAITIHQEPQDYCAISSPIIFTASSTNVALDGFKYVVRVESSAIPPIDYIVSPNPNGYLVFNAQSSMSPYLRNSDFLADWSLTRSIHGLSESDLGLLEVPDSNTNGWHDLQLRIFEAWDVDGVFTIDDASEVVAPVKQVYNYQDFTTRDGFNPSLVAQIGHENGDQSRIMSDRLPSTYYWQYAETVSLNLSNTIYVPVRESDYGVFCIRGQWTNIPEPTQIKLSILPNSGPPVQVVLPIPASTSYSNFTMYPANLNDSPIAGIIKPQDYPNWKAIYFQVLNDADEQVSMTYVMFNVDRAQTGICNCHDYTPIRLAWVGRRGGWEYYNFNMLSEQEYATEQKVSKRIVGNYGDVGESTDFTFNTFDESERVVYKKIDKFITCSTDKLQQGEWEFLKGLILSKQVHWVHDDGTHTPVIVQDSNIRVRNINAKTLEPLTIRIKVAQDQPN
jgi:hypothetical protein